MSWSNSQAEMKLKLFKFEFSIIFQPGFQTICFNSQPSVLYSNTRAFSICEEQTSMVTGQSLD